MSDDDHETCRTYILNKLCEKQQQYHQNKSVYTGPIYKNVQTMVWNLRSSLIDEFYYTSYLSHTTPLYIVVVDIDQFQLQNYDKTKDFSFDKNFIVVINTNDEQLHQNKISKFKTLLISHYNNINICVVNNVQVRPLLNKLTTYLEGILMYITPYITIEPKDSIPFRSFVDPKTRTMYNKDTLFTLRKLAHKCPEYAYTWLQTFAIYASIVCINKEELEYVFNSVYEYEYLFSKYFLEDNSTDNGINEWLTYKRKTLYLENMKMLTQKHYFS